MSPIEHKELNSRRRYSHFKYAYTTSLKVTMIKQIRSLSLNTIQDKQKTSKVFYNILKQNAHKSSLETAKTLDESPISSVIQHNPKQTLYYHHLFYPYIKPYFPNRILNNDPVSSSSEKRGKEYRNAFYNKIISARSFNSNKHIPLNHCIIIFDWDDTLMCTTYLYPNEEIKEREQPFNQKELRRITRMKDLVIQLLTKAIAKGEVYIITAASLGWVEETARKYYQSEELNQLLMKITIISARHEYDWKYPKNDRMWKMVAFQSLVRNIDYAQVMNILNIGDSLNELEAGKELEKKFSIIFIKSIKFKPKPNMKELNMQLKLVIKQFEEILSIMRMTTIKAHKK